MLLSFIDEASSEIPPIEDSSTLKIVRVGEIF